MMVRRFALPIIVFLLVAGAGRAENLDPGLVHQAQSALAALGYRPGPVDGAMGPRTQAALDLYALDEGLPAETGVSQNRLAELRSDVAALAALPFQTPAPYAFAIDVAADQVLLDKNAHRRLYPASMTKMMTALLVFDAIETGKLRPEMLLETSTKAWRKRGSRMFLEPGSAIPVEDLLRGLIVQSGNDAATVFAESLSETEEAFALLMTNRAQSLGMNGTQFRNPTGWPDPGHYSTAQDMATLGLTLLRDYPQWLPLYAERSFRHNNITQENRNPIVMGYPGGVGLKTGHTDISGYSLTGVAERGGRTILIVVAGLYSEKARAEAAFNLLDWAFSQP